MQYLKSQAIVLRRLNYGEADRIITVITKDSGKLVLIAKGVRKSTSKLAGGIELFSVSNIQYIKGKGEMDTLISARIDKHFNNIILQMDTLNIAYSAINIIDKLTVHGYQEDYYSLLLDLLESLDQEIPRQLVFGKFCGRLLSITGHGVDINRDINGDKFYESSRYNYNFERSGFEPDERGYSSNLIKVIKLLSSQDIKILRRITGMKEDLELSANLLKKLVEYHLQIKVD